MKKQKSKFTKSTTTIILMTMMLLNCSKKEEPSYDDPYNGAIFEETDFSQNFVGEWELYEIVADMPIDLNSDNFAQTRILWPNRGVSPENRVIPEMFYNPGDCPLVILTIDQNGNYTLKKDSFCGDYPGLGTETGTYTVKNGDRVVFSNKFSVFDQAFLGKEPIELNTHLIRAEGDYEMWLSKSVNFGYVLNYTYYNKYDNKPTKLSFIFHGAGKGTELQPEEIIAKMLE